MGMRLGFGRCSTNYAAPAPNPDPSRWELIWVKQFKAAHVLMVRYLDCTNFEGIKIMVFRGQYVSRERLDPHFSKDRSSPIARFRPDDEGVGLAEALAVALSKVIDE